MSTIGSHKNISEGLVLHYDIANIRCFRGETTTNIFPRSSTSLAFTSAFNGSSYEFGSSTNIQQIIDNTQRFDNRSSVTKVSRINSDVSQLDYVLLNLSSTSNSIRTLSFWYYGTYGTKLEPYNNDGLESIYYLDDNNTWQGGSTAQMVPCKIKQWQKITLKIVNNGTAGTGLSWMVLHADTGSVTLNNTEYWLFTMFQYEEKDHATPYTPTSRGTTVSTGGGIADLSLKNNNIINFSNILYNDINCGVLNFSGSGTALNTSNLDLTYTKSISISFWFKTSRTSLQILFELGTGGNDGFFIGMSEYGVNGAIELASNNISPSGWFLKYSSGSYNDNKWHHGICILDRTVSDQIKIYIDNILDSSNTGLSTTNNKFFLNSTLYIGSRANSSYLYQGYMSQIMIYDRILSTSEITQLYDSQKSRYL